jgi:outer membrane protein OmpA-like peptidoglycan-associated protein
MYTLSTVISSRARRGALLAAVLVSASGCASLSNKEKGAAIGGAAGAAVGAVIGNQTGSTARGAIIGAVVGGVAGTVIGNQMDQQAKEIRQEVSGATVTRVGEGLTVTFASGLLYDVDSDKVRAEAAANLRALAASLGKYPNTDLMIVGHTDASGTTEYNQGLSQRRAIAASDYLVLQGVLATRLRSSGRGELEPIASNDTENGRLLNRRVEIAIFANAAAKKAAGQ